MRFVSIVIDSSSSLNKLIMSFLNLSTLGSLALCTFASAQSLYKPTLLEPKSGLILFRRYNPTSSHTSAPSKLLIVKLNNGFPSFLTQAPPSSNNKDFLAWFMVLIVFPSITIKDFAKLIDLSSSSIESQGQNSAILNLMNLHFDLFLIDLNYSIKLEVFLHWLH